MVIGVPKEVKDFESRVAVTPAGVQDLVNHGHVVMIEESAGALSGFHDDDYIAAGALVFSNAREVWNNSELVVKVKEPVESEFGYFRQGLVLFTYLHLAPLVELTEMLLKSEVTGIAYETVRDGNNNLPLLTPMSEVAGRLSVQVGSTFLQNQHGGSGKLLGGVPGVPPAKVCILGAGVVGTNAAKIAIGMGADVTIIDSNLSRLRDIDDIFGGRLKTLASNSYNIARASSDADLLIGAVLIPGASAPKLLTADMVRNMTPGSVIVDVAIDQGGCIETGRPTQHSNPSYIVDGVVHYCVTNMPAIVPNTSTIALTNATFPYLLLLANKGVLPALRTNAILAEGLNTYNGKLIFAGVAKSQGRTWTPLSCMLT
jgi:alanine dehydrogenase